VAGRRLEVDVRVRNAGRRAEGAHQTVAKILGFVQEQLKKACSKLS
jgi:hypothetical protein